MACLAVFPQINALVAVSSSPNPGWYAVYAPGNEFRALEGLKQSGIDAYLPTYTQKSYRDPKYRNKLVKPIDVPRPLFAGYLFCSFDIRHGLQSILRTPGVACIVSFGDTPYQISDQDMESIRALESAGLSVADCPFKPGLKVLVERGPLAGAYGVIDSLEGEPYLWVNLPIFGRSKRVKVEREWLGAA